MTIPYKTILIAPDKFKGSLTSLEFIQIAKKTIKKIDGDIKVIEAPLSDGGEGSLDSFIQANNAEVIKGSFCNGNFKYKKAVYGLKGDTAFIEIAETSGLSITKKKNPLFTTSFGAGEQIKDAIEKGAKNIYISVGGTSTTDAGCGMASALGFNFYKEDGSSVIPTGFNLKDIVRIERPKSDPSIKFYVLYDVLNPLFGKTGSAYTYAAQKGANSEEIELLDDSLKHFNDLAKEEGFDFKEMKGSGAGGGITAGSIFFLHAEMIKGTDYIFLNHDVDSKIKEADLIITGEGKTDIQSKEGKVVYSLYEKSLGKPFIAFTGVNEIKDSPFKIIEINKKNEPLKKSIKNTKKNLEEAIYNYFLSIK